MRAFFVDLADRRRLRALNDADEETTAEAARLKEAALFDFGVGNSVIGSWLYTKCHHHIPTTAVETAAVTATGDGVCSLLFNPEFFVDIGLDGVKFVLFHEARHLIQRHLHTEPELRADPVFTIATEVTVNHVAMRRLGVQRLPTRAGEPVGIDPREVYERYRDDLAGQGLDPLNYNQFVETDFGVYSELRRMAEPIVRPVPCLHLLLSLGLGADGEIPLDDDTVAKVVAEVLAEVARRAHAGNAAARQELLDLAARCGGADDRLEAIWGLLGLAALRGETPKTRRVDWWKRWLVDVLASRLRDGERLVYPKKLGAVLLSLGHEPMLLRRGMEREKLVLVAFDTSGSMPDHVVEWLTRLVGQTDGVNAQWLSFDGEVMPFKPGERVLGGGGTNFQNVVDYAEGRLKVGDREVEGSPDAVIMVTDGHAAPVKPREPEKWIWLITDGGDTWPERADPPMACHRVQTGER
ncbi:MULTISPECIES: hypothetical protein [Micromonospora]|uniref:Metallopeptidase domain-containing protein n=1 Tax=Micromonospora sicca TaxID=2202420 RepID=A0A317DN99_9ACTN|nr:MULTISPECIES: hypothetical protein [unclassified Micromonospora]MBM0224538.1 hypothetical protein [Micromonospora sp. ATA51]PWR14405.1 hypothetical protein DKT69_16605 [Micromonospora sp. 4G51]